MNSDFLLSAMSKVIAIGGVSRSGKTSLAHWLHQRLPNSMVLSQDDFVIPAELISKVRDRTDWEHPDSINWQAWQRAVTSNVPDCNYLIMEGLFMFQESASAIAIDHYYYLGMEKEAFVEERKKEQRWGKEPSWFIEHVWDSHFIHGLPENDIELNNYHNIQPADYHQILAQITS